MFKEFVEENKKLIQLCLALWVVFTLVFFVIYVSNNNNIKKSVPDEVYKKVLENYRNDTRINVTRFPDINLTILDYDS